ncbi:hypothetical protein NEMBOFW57_007987 [Staphylotrichum longicolle]|uniref:LITAF domain-containing protein n=1 Tax=Staphylotrichum longicolle TaxID=669026 RepID=A0AAD4HTV4_9PEZI|nr:hypothetical protein NEMBOFW57_007987 [Staphylotrichum longicolle]
MEQQQQPQTQPAPTASNGIEPAPPAYSPRSEAGPQAGNDTVQPPVPVKDLPTNLSAPTKQLPMSPQQPVPTVTPLNMLGDRPQWIDCPFCQRRTMTRLNTEGTSMQIVAGVLCCLLCVCLTCVPCLAHWFEETTYFCSQCNNKVAMRSENGQISVYGPAAAVPSKYT